MERCREGHYETFVWKRECVLVLVYSSPGHVPGHVSGLCLAGRERRLGLVLLIECMWFVT